jgi:hypothetical protein
MALPAIEENGAAEAAFQYVKQGFAFLSEATGGRLRSILKGFEEEIEYELQLPPCTVMERSQHADSRGLGTRLTPLA